MSPPRFVIERRPRRLSVPWPMAVLVATWVGLVIAWELVGPAKQPLCMFRRLTDVPCPTCGATRAVLALGSGRPAEALLYNPLLLVVGLAAVVWLVARLGLGRHLRVEATMVQRRWFWSITAAVCVLNWAYVVLREAG